MLCHTTKQIITVVTQLLSEVQLALKRWINDKGEAEVTDKEAREFIRLVQDVLFQKGFSMKYGSRTNVTGAVKVVAQKAKISEPSTEEDWKVGTDKTVHTIRSGGRVTVSSRTNYSDSRASTEGCFTCGRKGHGWRNYTERTYNKCGRKGHDVYQCRAKRKFTQARINVLAEHIARIEEGDDERAETIQQSGGTLLATLLDTGARPSVLDSQMLLVELQHFQVELGNEEVPILLTATGGDPLFSPRVILILWIGNQELELLMSIQKEGKRPAGDTSRRI